MKERLEKQLKYRLNLRLYNQILDYCERHSINSSEFSRLAAVYYLRNHEDTSK